MGDFNVKRIENNHDRVAFYHDMLKDLKAFDFMLNNGLIEQRSDTVGAEQEMCIVDKKGQPLPTALKILSEITDDRFTNELALYNLEVNLSPQRLNGDCFSRIEKELEYCLNMGRRVAAEQGSQIFLTGNLPTLQFRHLMFDYMTPEERYKILSQELLELRGHNFEIYLEGVDDFNATLDSVLFEACNTSFQLHLQIDPREFVKMHNWAQMISGPVLSVCCNSPLLFGRELWAENRIALFKQSLDTRGRKNHSREILPRVHFGNTWLRSSATELWKEDVVRFPILLRGYGDDDPMESLRQGITPKLKSVRLHNGTTYTWNRLCYGVANNSPHIRIECRYLPSGPSQIDEMANFAFWVGLMKGMPENYSEFWESTSFRVAKSNFIRAARTGISTVLHWFGKNYPAVSLICDVLLPMAEKGLQKMNVDEADISKFLSIIEARARTGQTGGQWQKTNYRKLLDKFKPALAARLLVQESLQNQELNNPVHSWENLKNGQVHSLSDSLITTNELVEDMMNREVITIRDNVSMEAVESILEWKGFHHLPVEDQQGNLTGMISAGMLREKAYQPDQLAKEIMTSKLITIGPGEGVEEAIRLMKEHKITCLHVVENTKLVGILTHTDLGI